VEGLLFTGFLKRVDRGQFPGRAAEIQPLHGFLIRLCSRTNSPLAEIAICRHELA
jgi:hypothetical protein